MGNYSDTDKNLLLTNVKDTYSGLPLNLNEFKDKLSSMYCLN